MTDSSKLFVPQSRLDVRKYFSVTGLTVVHCWNSLRAQPDDFFHPQINLSGCYNELILGP